MFRDILDKELHIYSAERCIRYIPQHSTFLTDDIYFSSVVKSIASDDDQIYFYHNKEVDTLVAIFTDHSTLNYDMHTGHWYSFNPLR